MGYHIGQQRVASAATRLLFCTCGLLLEELRAKGAEALEAHRVVIIDEVHERSVESDLVLAAVKQLLQKPQCRTR